MPKREPWQTKDGDRIRRLRGAIHALAFDIATLKQQLAAQRAIVVAGDKYRGCILHAVGGGEAMRVTSTTASRAAWNELLQARDAAKEADNAT